MPTEITLKVAATGKKKQTVSLTFSNEKGDTFCKENISLTYNNEINFSKYGKGLYFVKVETQQGLVTEKVMVQ